LVDRVLVVGAGDAVRVAWWAVAALGTTIHGGGGAAGVGSSTHGTGQDVGHGNRDGDGVDARAIDDVAVLVDGASGCLSWSVWRLDNRISVMSANERLRTASPDMFKT
jgi:hypothetical protein